MVDKVLLEHQMLDTKELINSRDFRTFVETLLKIHRNILHNENDVEKRRIKLTNPAFHSKIWRFPTSREVLQTCGWTNIDDELLVFNKDERLLDIISILISIRLVKPSDDEWNEKTKIEGPNMSEQFREEWLKHKASEQRKKDLEEFQKDKKYREDLARNVKAEHEADKIRQKSLHPMVGKKW